MWRFPQKDIINKYGYLDDEGRQALKNIANNKTPNGQGFYLESDERRNLIVLRNVNEKENIAEWSVYTIAGKFMSKLDRLLLILADNKLENGIEYFHYNEAYLMKEPTPEKFLEAFKKSELMIDLRMHLKESGGVRNRGTAYRMSEKNLTELYAKKKKLI